MMQQVHTGPLVIVPPVYTDDLSRMIGVLQQLQYLMSTWTDPTLADVAILLQGIQQDFGPGESLENIIQALVGRHLSSQMARRKTSVEVAKVVLS